MAEDPIKLFASRADRLPQPDETQTLREAIEKGIDQGPRRWTNNKLHSVAILGSDRQSALGRMAERICR